MFEGRSSPLWEAQQIGQVIRALRMDLATNAEVIGGFNKCSSSGGEVKIWSVVLRISGASLQQEKS